jgi:hypothetical protein
MARAYRFTIIRLPASSLEDAHEMIGRLTSIGLPRQSMNVAPREDGNYHVAVHTHEKNRARILRSVRGLTDQGASSAMKTGAMLGGAALIGAGLWAIWRNADRVQALLGDANEKLRSGNFLGDQDRATMRSARGDREVADSSGRTEHTDEPFALASRSTLGGGGQTGAAAPGQGGLGSGQYTSREQSASNIGAHTGGFTGGGSAGQAGAPKQPTNTEPTDAAVRAGTEGSVHAIS